MIIPILFFHYHVIAQEEKNSKTRIVSGLSAPELFHAGVTYRIANISQLGVSAGLGPTWGETFTAISLEHRLYFGKNDERIGQKTWFCRQGTSVFPLTHQFSLNLTIGKDIPFKNGNDGITLDFGLLSVPTSVKYWYDGSSEPSYSRLMFITYPALRFEFYFSL